MNYRCSIDDIVETLQNAKEHGKSCTLSIGAGCSVTAGIPTAPGFVEVIKERYSLAYERAQEKTYPKCMAELTNDPEVLINWSTMLIVQARTKAGEEANLLLAQAKEKSLRAEDIKPGSGAYNLACVSALEGDEAGCREWLEKSQKLGTLPDREHLMSDPDLESVRESEWFKKLVSEA
ncbi:MAG: hypothetical protein ACE5JP_17785 [Candidatus Bipolaricaulia bacterium]